MKNIIIIGNSAAGIAAVESIRSKDRESRITVVSDEDYTSYCRCVLSYYLSGEVTEEKLVYRPQEFYKENNIELILGKKVTRVEPKKNSIVLEDNQRLGYDSLLIATGASAKFPEIKGVRKRGVFGLRTIKDTKDILGLVPVTKTAVCLGGGLIGLKAACALKKRGIDIKVVVKSGQILSQVLDRTAADIIQKHLEASGIEIVSGMDAAEFLGNGDLKAVKLDSGKVIGCEIAVIGKGVSCNTAIVKNTDIKVEDGILADKFLNTCAENIFTAGDCAQAYDLVLGRSEVNALWPNAVEQGALAGKNILGEKLVYQGSLGMNSVEFFGLAAVSLGLVKETQGMEVLSRLDNRNKIYKKIVLKDNRIKGVILLGKIENSGLYLRLIREKIDIREIREDLLSDNFNYAKIMEFLETKERFYLSSIGGKKCLK